MNQNEVKQNETINRRKRHKQADNETKYNALIVLLRDFKSLVLRQNNGYPMGIRYFFTKKRTRDLNGREENSPADCF